MKRKAEADYRHQLEEERQRAIEESIGFCTERKIKRGKYMDVTVIPYAVEGNSSSSSVR